MSKQKIDGVVMPDGYNSTSHLAIQSKLSNAHNHEAYSDYVLSLRGTAYRYKTCTEHHKEHVTLVTNSSGYTTYEGEREFFGFFATGLSAIECFFYSAYAIAALKKSESFPIQTDKDKRNIIPKKVLKKFKKYFASDSLTTRMELLTGDTIFHDWKVTRNMLTHRLVPSRIKHGTNRASAKPIPDDWKVEDQPSLDENFTGDRHKWLTEVLSSLLSELEKFTQTHFGDL